MNINIFVLMFGEGRSQEGGDGVIVGVDGGYGKGGGSILLFRVFFLENKKTISRFLEINTVGHK